MARPYVRFAHGSRSGLLGRGFAGGRVSSTVATVATLQHPLLHRLPLRRHVSSTVVTVATLQQRQGLGMVRDLQSHPR